jgi:hypothetical protein
MVAQLSAFISDDPVLASRFAVCLLAEPRHCADGSWSILEGVCRQQSSDIRAAIIRRILRWYIGYQSPQDDNDRVATAYFPSWLNHLELLSQFDEYSDSLLRSVIGDPVNRPASQLLI